MDCRHKHSFRVQWPPRNAAGCREFAAGVKPKANAAFLRSPLQNGLRRVHYGSGNGPETGFGNCLFALVAFEAARLASGIRRLNSLRTRTSEGEVPHAVNSLPLGLDLLPPGPQGPCIRI